MPKFVRNADKNKDYREAEFREQEKLIRDMLISTSLKDRRKAEQLLFDELQLLKRELITVKLKRRILLTQNTILYKRIAKNKEELKQAEARHKRKLGESRGQLQKTFSAKSKLQLSEVKKLNVEKERVAKMR